MEQILIGIPKALLTSVTTTGPSEALAIPTRYCVWGAQLSIDPTQDFTLDIECSIDGIIWGAVASFSQADLINDVYFTIVDTIIGKFVRANVLTNAAATAISLVINGQTR